MGKLSDAILEKSVTKHSGETKNKNVSFSSCLHFDLLFNLYFAPRGGRSRYYFFVYIKNLFFFSPTMVIFSFHVTLCVCV